MVILRGAAVRFRRHGITIVGRRVIVRRRIDTKQVQRLLPRGSLRVCHRFGIFKLKTHASNSADNGRFSISK
jgi:hypothetical protein